MESSEPKAEHVTSWWISSLAISVVCCAVLFVVFASYIVDLKSNDSSTAMKVDMLEQRQKELVVSIENLQRRTMVQQIQILPAANGATQQIPLSTVMGLQGAAGQPPAQSPPPPPPANAAMPPVAAPALPVPASSPPPSK